jgi:hypothetical protein
MFLGKEVVALQSGRLTDLKKRYVTLIDAYKSADHLTFNSWFTDAIHYIQQLLYQLGRSKPFFTLTADWAWVEKAAKEKASENYGAKLLLEKWPTRLIREAEILESQAIPDHSQLRQGQGYKADFQGYSIKIEQGPDGGVAILERAGAEIYKGRPTFRFERGLEPDTSQFMLHAAIILLKKMDDETTDPELLVLNLKWSRY